MTLEPTITPIIPDTFEYQTYSNSDENLIVQSELDTVFSASTDYIEYYVYDQNKDLIYPSQTVPLLDYNVREGDVLLNPSSNLESLGFDIGEYNISYSFYRKRAASSIDEKYFISNISSDRTEIRLDSNTIENNDIISSVNDFIQYRETSTYFVDFYLNFGQNQTVIANNIKLETEEGIDPTILIKLYEPLPLEFSNKSELWVVELLSSPQAYKVDFPFEPFVEDDFTYIAGPNYNLNVIGETASPGEQFSYNTLVNSDLTSSINQIQSLLNEKEININIDYEKFSNFVNFSSAKTRLENFYYKVDLIQSASNQINTFLDQIATDTTYTPAYSSSVASLTGTIDTIIKNFDGYEYFLYFNSGSSTSYPKSNTQPPFVLYPTGSTEVQNWITSSAATASNYDDNNRDWLYNSIPEYLRDDPANRNYELFVDMVGQYYDNVWVYTKDVTNKFDADNRLDYGISKDLVSDAIKDFAVKLYSNNFNTDDLFTAFLGLTPSGSAFPFPYMTGSIGGAVATPTGYEYVDTKISASNDIVPLDDVNKSIYKRIYHNIPYLLKTKGTIAGLRALITSYGIPDTILRISEFGGKDRNESQDYDLKQNVFNYAFDTGVNATNFVSSSLEANPLFPVQNGTNKARTIQLRFKPSEIPLPTNNVASSNIRYSQSIFSTNDEGGNLVLEYTGLGLVSGSYSGSIPSPYDTYGTLKWIPARGGDPNLSASVYLPFFNGDWWSVQMNVNGSNPTASLYAANKIDGKIGFNESSSVGGFDDSFYYQATTGYLNKNEDIVFADGTTYTPFSGLFQELRYYVNEISQSNFYDYTVNPYSNEGNGINSTPNQQFFRAALGSQLSKDSTFLGIPTNIAPTSIHPRVTGSAVQITQSFSNGTSDYFTTPKTNKSTLYVENKEFIYQDQVPAGIKNRITDKIQTEKVILSEAPYGFPNPTASVPEISSVGNDTQTISPMESMQQTSFTSQSITPNINYLEVAFSPSNQINDDINAQLGYFNLGEFIGDPRFVSSSLYTYPDLDRLRNAYFEKYMDNYDVVDFVRLIKFFDNSLFKMIKDFTPARTSLSSGVVVKQHILERNRQRPAQVTSSLHDYEGLVVNLPKDYSSGSTDFPQYSTEGSSIYKFSGGTGGSFERFNGLQTYPQQPGQRYGQLLGKVGGINYTGADLIPAITSNTLISPLTNGNFNNITVNVNSGGAYPINANIIVQIKINGGNIAEINVETDTSPADNFSIGNTFTIFGTDFGQGGGIGNSLTFELTGNEITFTSPVTIPYNRFGVTQSWQDGNDGSILNTTNFNQSSSQFISGSYLGPRKFPKDNQSEFYDGIFSGSMIIVATQSLNPGCDPYLNANDTPVVYKPLFFGLATTTNTGFEAVVQEGDFNDQSNVPPPGYAWIASSRTNVPLNGIQQVQAIKLNAVDASGVEVINYLDDFDNLRVLFPDAILPYGANATEYIITGRTIYADHIILQVSQTEGNNIYQAIQEGAGTTIYYPITSSDSGGSMNWSLRAKTDWVTSLTDSESLDTVQQGVFLNSTVPTQEQNVFYYNNFDSATDDALGFFNPGSQTFTTKRIIEQNQPLKGAYTIPYTPNIPWHIEASFKYSASLNTDVQGIITDTGIYHKGTEYSGLATLVDQNFALRATSTRGFYVAAESAGYASALLAAGAPDLTSADPIAYYSSTSFFYSTFLEELFSDELLTTNFNALTVGKYYKFSNLVETSLGVQDYFVVYISLSPSGGRNGALQSGNRQPSSPPKTATTSVINITNPSNFFRPAPREVSGLGQVLYNGNNWNTQLPGNSGSGTNMGIYGGHPKIKVATTNSMEWSFAKLKLAGTPPTLGGGGASAFVPFTGSAVPNNVTNSSFDLDFSDIATFTPTFLNQTALIVTGVPNMGQTYDGSIFIRWSGQNSVARSLWDAGTALAQFNNIDFTLSCTVQSFDNGSEVNKSFNVQLCEERWYPSGEGGPGFSSPRVISVLDTVAADPTGLAEWNGELIQFSGLYGYLLNGTGLPSGGQPADNYSSRLFFQIKNNETEDFEYEFTLEDFAVRIYYDETGGGGGVNLAYPVNGPVTFATGDFNSPTDGFQDGDTNVVEGVATTDYYAQCVVNAYLKRTGSDSSGDYDYIITSSVWPNGGYSGSIYSGSTIQFTDNFPVLVSEDTDLSATTMSTYANPGDMYYIEYEFKDFKNAQIGGSQIIQQQVAFISSTSGEVEDLIEITSTGSGGSAPTYNINNSSVILRRADSLSSTVIFPGTEVLSLPWDTTSLTETSVGSATVLGTYNGNFSANEIYRLSMEVDKAGYLGSGLVITEFSASIFPGASAWSPTTDPRAYNNFRQAQDVDFIVPTYYAGVLPFNLALDCQPLLNNFILQRQSNFIMDVDYNNQSGSIIPVNQEQILENIAVKAAVPDSNYTALSSINPRYNGVKSTSAQLNVWNVGDTGTYGKNPTVELRDAYFGYFNDISDPYPNINSLTQVNISYLIDEQGNALPPSLNDQLSVDTFRQVFPNTTVGRLAIKDGKNRYTPLSTPSAISRIMEYVTPICYSQNSGNNYSPSIPLSGSGYISRYDNDDENDIDFAQFSVAGTASIDTTAQLQTVSYYLDTAESNTSPAGAISPYSVTSLTGSASYPQGTWGGSNGDALNNQQIVSVQHSIVTTYVSETNGVRDELDLTFKMFTGSNEDTQSPFNLEGIDCKVYTETGQVYLLKDVDNYGWFTYTNLPTTQTIRHRDTNFYLAGFNRWSYTRVPIPGGGIHATVDWEMFETLFDLGLMRERAPRNGSGVQALEWIFKANSGNVDIKVGDQISWKMEGFFKDARGGFQQGYFFPTAYEGAYTPMMIKGMGALDYKLEEANKAAAPFWTFSGSATDLSTDLSIIEMSSSNFNEAYGTGFYQGDLPYEPGFSEYFPGNVEPKTTDFDKIQNPIEFLEGDEIRFGNNESFTYTILDVFAPSENVSGSISSSGTPITSAKVKLKLDRAVDPSINKDFFLVRRTITTPQSLYLDTPFPYGILSSGSISKGIKSTGSFALTSSTAAGSFPSGDGEGLYTASISEVEALSTPGILFPDFPTEYLTESASMIVNDLISKGVIES